MNLSHFQSRNLLSRVDIKFTSFTNSNIATSKCVANVCWYYIKPAYTRPSLLNLNKHFFFLVVVRAGYGPGRVYPRTSNRGSIYPCLFISYVKLRICKEAYVFCVYSYMTTSYRCVCVLQIEIHINRVRRLNRISVKIENPKNLRVFSSDRMVMVVICVFTAGTERRFLYEFILHIGV